jgi:hypothetical protein
MLFFVPMVLGIVAVRDKATRTADNPKRHPTLTTKTLDLRRLGR